MTTPTVRSTPVRAVSVRARSQRVWRAFLPGVVVLTLLAATLSGCTSPSPKSAIGPSASPCFRTLPTALAAVGHRGHFLGVRLLSMKVFDLSLRHHHVAELPKSRAGATTMLCVVGYRGPFVAKKVESPWPQGRTSADDALVLVDLANGHVVAVVLLKKSPLHIARI
jgi:hypothetical protein